MLLFLSYLIAIVQRCLAAALMWMLTLRSSSEWSLEVQFLYSEMRRFLWISLVCAPVGLESSAARFWWLIRKPGENWFWTFLAITFLSSNSCVVFSRFSLACFSIYWVIAEWETQVCLSCKITPDASAVSESGEEGGKNPKSVDQLCNWFSKTLLNRSTWKSVAI